MTETTQLPVPVEGLTIHRLAALAREVAYNIRPLDAILADFKITQEQYDSYLQMDFYKSALEGAVIDWNKASSTEKRLQLQAQAGLEDGLPTLTARMTDKDSALPAAVEVGKLLTKIAGIGEPGKSADAKDRFVITINLGDGQPLKFEKDVTPNTPPMKEIEHEPS